MPSEDVFDFVVVGTGTAGATLVNRPSADGRHRVCAPAPEPATLR